jgi:glycosyltransferase involved in cell wall biosynthesis
MIPPLSGFSIVKNASVQEYPVEVALRSALPLVDELIVDVGVSEDDTLERVRRWADSEGEGKVRILERDWGAEWGRSTVVHSEETNAAMAECRHDWALYIQADEVLHADDYEAFREALGAADRDPRAEGLLFDYLHFYGSPDWVLWGRRSYRREVRVVRRSSGIRSVSGAQGFMVGDRKPRVRPARARVFHYGYVKTLRALTEKRKLGARYAGRDDADVDPFRWRRHGGLVRFEGTHPPAARAWIASEEWPFDPAAAPRPELTPYELKVRVSDAIERLTGRRPLEHRNYVLLD